MTINIFVCFLIPIEMKHIKSCKLDTLQANINIEIVSLANHFIIFMIIFSMCQKSISDDHFEIYGLNLFNIFQKEYITIIVF